MVIDFFLTHAGKGTVGVCLAALLIAWPPALPWIAAVALLQWSARHLILAFKEMEREEARNAVPAKDSQRGAIVPRHDSLPARPQV